MGRYRAASVGGGRSLARTGAAAAVIAVWAGAASADPLDAAYAAYLEAWQAAPLVIEAYGLVAAPATGFGVYAARAGNVFAAGEPIHIYLQPSGYALVPGNGVTSFGLASSVTITGPGGETGVIPDVADTEMTSFMPITETFLSLTLTLNVPLAGEYLLDITLRDKFSDETTVVTIPVVFQ